MHKELAWWIVFFFFCWVLVNDLAFGLNVLSIVSRNDSTLWPLISASGGRCFCDYLVSLKFETLCCKAYTLRCWEVGGVAVPCVFSTSVSCWAISRRRHIDDWRSPEEEDSFFALPTGNTQHVLGPANTSVKHVLYYRAFNKQDNIKKNPSFPIADLITTNKN